MGCEDRKRPIKVHDEAVRAYLEMLSRHSTRKESQNHEMLLIIDDLVDNETGYF
jgi:hypothetical protein